MVDNFPNSTVLPGSPSGVADSRFTSKQDPKRFMNSGQLMVADVGVTQRDWAAELDGVRLPP